MKPTKKPSTSSLRQQNNRPTFNKDASPFSPAPHPHNQGSDPADLTYTSQRQQQPQPQQEEDPQGGQQGQNQFTPNPIVRKSTTAASPTDFNATPVPYHMVITNIPGHVNESDLAQLISSRVGISGGTFEVDQFVPEHDNTITAILKVPDLATSNKIITALHDTEWEGKLLQITVTVEEDQPVTYHQTLHPHDSRLSGNYNFGQPIPPAENYWKPLLSRNTSASSNHTLSHRSSSLDSRRTFSRTTSKSSVSSLGIPSKRNSQSSSISSDPLNSKKPVPSFIMNMIQGNDGPGPDRNYSIEGGLQEEDESEAKEHKQEHTDQEDGNADDEEDFIWVPATEEGEEQVEDSNNLIKVNAKRLFIGNVPYSSNWSSLRNFLVNKANEWEPDNNISILRVEIPVQQVPRNDSYYMFLANRGFASTPKSRGFAIVTTGDRHSSQKLIDLFNNTDFEGRSLTVRYDKFPEFNNYVMQQMHAPGGPYHSQQHQHQQQQQSHHGMQLPAQPPPLPYFQQYPTSPSSTNPRNRQNLPPSAQQASNHSTSPSLISSLAFERNLYQRNFYYASTAAGGSGPGAAGGGAGIGGNIAPPIMAANQNQNQSRHQSPQVQQISGAPIPHLLSPGINQFIPPPGTGGYFQYPQQQGQQRQQIPLPQQPQQGQQPGGARSLQFAPPPPHPAQQQQSGGAGSPTSQTYMYWPHPYYNPGTMYAPAPFHQYQYAGSPQHYQQFPQQMNNQRQFNQQQQYQRQYQNSKETTPTPSRGSRGPQPPTQQQHQQPQPADANNTVSEEEKARDLMNSIKDLSLDK
ncbi:hypothetical protein Cantr_06209 [Candida viswanathii]|uniref:RRM domain-containing protein n=1 Tax=Candida viswanathii TaxID=5486 RepID=A0A367XZF4_9ASCO|nr:hypothetical protein Cantr_06209 [Candida viswanathii]